MDLDELLYNCTVCTQTIIMNIKEFWLALVL